MRHFLSPQTGKILTGAATRSFNSCVVPSCFARNIFAIAFFSVAAWSSSFGQLPFTTSRGDNGRTGANTNETLLTPANVSSSGFGRLFSFPVDYIVMAQPLFVPNVNIPGQGTHNVIYVVTQADSVYAIDADNGAQLWYASMLNVGGTTASGKYLPCGTGPGFTQEGIVGTPVIDPNSNTIYLVAKTLLDTTVRHHLHALDITTGAERAGSPVLITATSTSNKGHVTTFNSLHQKNRPGLLLLNGIVYMGFGSNFCDDSNTGWMLSYDATTLSQLKAFNVSPDYGVTSIWQAGNGIAADQAGNIFAETSEAGSHGYDLPNGGQTYCMSVLKFGGDLSLQDYFTPWSVAYLNANDLDLSSTGALVLPDQPGAYPHELIASGKQGVVYVLNRDSLGLFAPNDSQVLQEITLVPARTNDVLFASPAYWNNTVYFAPDASPLMAFPLSGGLLGTPLKVGTYTGSHSPSVSANGNTNGILWVISGTQLLAFDAVSMKQIYGTSQAAGGRDALPAVGHFVTQTVANGRVYVGTKTTLEAYALFHAVTITGGSAQTATVASALPAPILVNAANPYNGQPDVGATVNFSDGAKGGSFNPASAVTDANGNASTTYTVPQKAGTYTLTISGSGFSTITTTATATAGPAIKIVNYGGARQSGAAGSNLANPIVAQAQDIYKNGVAGITVNFAANKGAVPTPASAVSDSSGLARTTLQLPTTVSAITVTASATGFKNITFPENSVAGPTASITVNSGNNQAAPAGTQLPESVVVLLTDQYGNPTPGQQVTFSDGGAGGSFLNNNPFMSNNAGTAIQVYVLPPNPGTVTINATVSGVATPAVFTETAQ